MNAMKNKYHAKPTDCFQCHRHASMSEAARCDYWHILKRAGEVLHVDIQPRVSLPCGDYRPDFAIWRRSKPTGAIMVEFEDVKGMVTAEFRRIRRTFDSVHPAAPLRVVKRKGKGWEQV